MHSAANCLKSAPPILGYGIHLPMDPKSIVINCTQSSSWLYTVIWGIALPLFVAYVASAAYAFQRRRSDIEVVHKAMKDMRTLTMFALDRLAGKQVNPQAVRDHAMDLIARVRLEVLHRPQRVQKRIHDVLVDFLQNAEIADGRMTDTPNNVLARQTMAEEQLVDITSQLTIVEALSQAWSNPGVNVSFTSLFDRYFR